MKRYRPKHIVTPATAAQIRRDVGVTANDLRIARNIIKRLTR